MAIRGTVIKSLTELQGKDIMVTNMALKPDGLDLNPALQVTFHMAEITVVNLSTPPSSPCKLRGSHKTNIAGCCEDKVRLCMVSARVMSDK